MRADATRWYQPQYTRRHPPKVRGNWYSLARTPARATRSGATPIEGHPLPDLTGASPEAIADALCAAIDAAHGTDPLWASEEERADGQRLCPRCVAALELASRYADPGPLAAWPDPLMRVFQDELEWRREMDRWEDRPGTTFDRAAWQADLDRQRAEHFYTDHYRGQIPPWVILGEAGTVAATARRGPETLS